MSALSQMVATHQPCTHEQFTGDEPHEFRWTRSEQRELDAWSYSIEIDVMREIQ